MEVADPSRPRVAGVGIDLGPFRLSRAVDRIGLR